MRSWEVRRVVIGGEARRESVERFAEAGARAEVWRVLEGHRKAGRRIVGPGEVCGLWRVLAGAACVEVVTMGYVGVR